DGRLAAGFLDGIPEESLDTGLAYHSSSVRLTIAATDMKASYTGQPTTGESSGAVAAGALLLGSTQSELFDDTFATSGSGLAFVAAGLWTVATQDLLVTGSRIADYASIDAGRIAAAHIDGAMQPPRTPVPDLGSVRLTMIGNVWAASLSTQGISTPIEPITQMAACQILIGSRDSQIGGRAPGDENTVSCTTFAGGSAELVQIWTLATNNVSIIGNRIGSRDTPTASGLGAVERWVGVRDGHALIEAAEAIDVGSAKLLVDANRIYGPFNLSAETFIGVWLDRDPSTTQLGRVWLKNNAILGTAAMTSVGIRVDYAPVEIVNNTIQAAWCPEGATVQCSNPVEAIALLAAGGSGHTMVVASNIFSANAGNTINLVVDRDSDPVGDVRLPSFSVFAGNILNRDGSWSDAQYRYYCIGGAPSDNSVGSGICYSRKPPYIEELLSSFRIAGAEYDSITASVSLCPYDGFHLASAGSEAEDWGYDSYRPELDIDGDPRDGVSHDAGADEIDGSPTCSP
ncbi:MAG: hypothetical protein V3T05_11945, partial [Myxococcota bacterium]